MILDTFLNLLILLAAIVLVWRLDQLISSKGKARAALDVIKGIQEAARKAAEQPEDLEPDPGLRSLPTLDEHRIRELEYEQEEIVAKARRAQLKRRRLALQKRRKEDDVGSGNG